MAVENLEVVPPGSAVKASKPSEPLSVGPKTGPGKGGFKRVLSKCERMNLADQKRKRESDPGAFFKRQISKADRLALKDKQAEEKLKQQAEKLAEKAQKELEKREKEAEKLTKTEERRKKEEEKEQKAAEREAKKMAKEEKAALPKKPMTAFFIFTGDRRASVKEANPEASVSDIAKLLGAQWNELSEEEKQPYEEKAAADKERYAQEVERLLPLIQCEAVGIPIKEPRGEKKGRTEDDMGGREKRQKVKEPKVATRHPAEVSVAKPAIHFYKREHRAAVAEAHPEADPHSLVRMMEESFEALSHEERAPYEERAAADMERYNSEIAAENEKREAERANKKEAKAAARESKAAEKMAKKKSAKVTTKANEVELRKPTEEEQAVLDAVEAMRKAGVDHEGEVCGWRIKLKRRPVRDDGKPTGGPVLTVFPPGEKKALLSVLNIKRKMGILGAPLHDSEDAKPVQVASTDGEAEDEAMAEELARNETGSECGDKSASMDDDTAGSDEDEFGHVDVEED